MYNPITYIKDVIELVRNPPGEAMSAMEITEASMQRLQDNPDIPTKYIQLGDFFLEFENNLTICPRDEFFKHYEFTQEPLKPGDVTPVRTIKPL